MSKSVVLCEGNSTMKPTTVGVSQEQTGTQERIEDPERVDTILGILDDSNNRAILEATSDEPQSAQELADRCGLALSTTYRKLNQLVEADLLQERRRITGGTRHVTVFDVRVTDIQIHVSTEDDIDIAISWTATTDNQNEYMRNRSDQPAD
jgi:DNA-binding transcriptional ArsR family regulator